MTNNPFSPYSAILQAIEANPAAAYQRMWEICENQVTNYTAATILQIFISNLTANKKKYDQLIDFYSETFFPFDDFSKNETYEHTRTPDLESSSTSTGTGSASTTMNQTKTTKTTPNNYTTETAHKVAPFDNNAAVEGLRYESQDTSVESGSTSTAESYSGSPDITTSTSSTSSLVSTTGTETNEYTKIIHGRSGRRPTSEVIEDGLKAASMLDILDIIIEDIADQIFLQVWI